MDRWERGLLMGECGEILIRLETDRQGGFRVSRVYGMIEMQAGRRPIRPTERETC